MKKTLLLTLALLPLTSRAITRSFTGGGADDNWNNPANWNPTGAPADGDNLVFPAGTSAETNNNLTGRTFGSLTFQDGTTVTGNAFTLTGGISSTPGGTGGTVVIEPNVTLGAGQTFTSGGGVLSTLTLSGSVTFGAHSLTLAGSRPLTFGGLTGSSVAGSQLLKTGTGQLRFGPTAIFISSSPLTWSNGSLDVDGTFQTPLTLTGGTLTGGGALGVGLDASAGVIVPDEDDLNVSGTTLLRGSAILRVELIGPSDEHALECSGGTVTIQDNATLEFAANGYVPVRGDTFFVLQKSTAGVITGAFSNVAEGADFADGTSIVRFSYLGGNGNDGALSTVSTTRTWDGGATLNDNWEDADNWSANVAPLAGDILTFPAGIDATDRGLDNNFPTDTTFRHLSFTGSDYTVRGNRFRLTHGISTLAGQFTSIDTDVVLAQDQTFDLNGTLHLDLLDNIVTNGRTLTLAGTGRLDGSISGTGGLRVPAGSVIQLSANSSYTGITTVEAGGELVVAGRDEALGSAAGRTEVLGQLEFNSSSLPIGGRLATAENLLLLPSSTLAFRGHGSSRIVHTGTVEFAGPGSVLLSFVPNTDVTFEGVISGPANVTLDSSDTAFTGNTSNTFSGPLSVTRGSLILEKSNPGVLAVPCASFILQGDGTEVETRQDEQIADNCHVQIGSGSELSIGNVTARTETIGSLTLGQDGRGNANVSGPANSVLILRGNLTVPPATGFFHRIDSLGLRIDGTPSIFDIADAGDQAVDLRIEDSKVTRSGTAAIRKTGSGMLQFSDDDEPQTVVVPIEIVAGIVDIAADCSGSPITLNGGTLSGSDACGSVTSAAGGGTIHPGGTGSIVVFSTGSLILNAATTLKTRVENNIPGTGHAQVSVTGSVSLGGTTLLLDYPAGFSVAIGQSIFPLLNDGTDPIVGTFAGLPQGAYIDAPDPHAGGWIISYSGGSGNDVSLARVSEPPVAPRLNTVTFSRGGAPGGQDLVTLAGTGTAGTSFTLQASTNLTAWSNLQSISPAANGVLSVSLNQPPGIPKRFFRLKP